MTSGREHNPCDERREALPRFAFLSFACSGPDPARDDVQELELCGETPEGLHSTRWLVPQAAILEADVEEFAPGRGHRPPRHPSEGRQGLLEEVLAALGGRQLVVADHRRSLRWWSWLGGGDGPALPTPISIGNLIALLFPGRDREGDEECDPWSAFAPQRLELLSARGLAEAFYLLLDRHRERPRELQEFVLAALERCREAYSGSDEETAELLGRLLPRLSGPEREQPSRTPHPARLYGAVAPAFARDLEALNAADPLPRTKAPGLLPPLGESERALLERIHREALPREFAPGEYRAGQHELSRRVLELLQAPDFLLVDAPTGTGKTLAYAIPLLLWSWRSGVRTAISTYTRALQDQAFYREMPRALRLLREEGWEGSPRIAMLKGRANYVCGRMLAPLCPELSDPPEDHLAWFVLALFALTDAQGDFDRLPLRSPLEIPQLKGVAAAMRRLKRDCAGESQCCTRPSERARCAGHIARKRAQRSHLVVTNHAFVLSDTAFFSHVLFDECDHLHEQAMAIVSLELGAADLQRDLRLLAGRGARDPGLLSRLEARFPLSAGELFEDPVGRAIAEARDRLYQLEFELEEFDDRARSFLRWRARREHERHSADRHEMLREYVSQELGEKLLEARDRLYRGFGEFSARLATLQEELSLEPGRTLGRTSTRLARTRTGLSELVENLRRWLPAEEGVPRFDEAWFHDIQEGQNGSEWKLVRRILLPHVYLGRYLFPRLASAVLISASTHLCGSFDTMRRYLGLDLLEDPEAIEVPGSQAPPDLVPRAVHCWRAPAVFDHRRVLVTVPKDAPPYRAHGPQKARFLSYVVSFVGFLAERSCGRVLVLFTNLQDLSECGRRLQPFLRARDLKCYWQTMGEYPKEELVERFRSEARSVLMGVDTFWYGVDFPGETLEQVVIVKLPYGAIDRFQQAQCAVMGAAEQRRRIYMPQAAAMFRQGFGRLQRHRDDRGAVHILDRRILDPRHRAFLRELPGFLEEDENRPELYTGPSAHCIERALEHSGRLEEARALGFDFEFRAPEPLESADPGEPPF